jgi:hypothetical protein
LKRATKLPLRLVGGALLGGVVACQPPAFPSDPPSPYDPGIDDTPPPTLSAAEVGAAIPAALNEFFRIDPEELFGNYDAVRLQFDDNDPTAEGACPQYDLERGDGVQSWRGDPCTAQSGAVFGDGLDSLISPAGSTTTDDDGAVFNIASDGFLAGTGRIFDPAGNRFDMSGDANYARINPQASPGDTFSDASLRGVFFWNGPGSGNTWLPDGLSLDFDVEANDTPSAGTRFIRINGIVSGLSGTFQSIIFGDIRNVTTGDPATTCDQEPSNAISLRDAKGHWYTVAFQGARNPGEHSGAQCDGCGVLFLDNNDQPEAEQVCADFSRLLNWGGRPW